MKERVRIPKIWLRTRRKRKEKEITSALVKARDKIRTMTFSMAMAMVNIDYREWSIMQDDDTVDVHQTKESLD